MADFMSGAGGPPVTNGPPTQTGSPRGIRGPRVIMQERQERERLRAEREALQRQKNRQEETDRLHAAEERRMAEDQMMEMYNLEQEEEKMKREQRAAAGAGPSTGRAAPVTPDVDPATIRRRQRAAEAKGQSIPTTPKMPPISHMAQQRAPQAKSSRPPPQPQFTNPIGDAAGMSSQATTNPPQMGESSAAGAAGASAGGTRNSFPHAFERWEALSAHWEGLTSFWIRQLQQRAGEIDRDPLSQQLARQVTDLSAAGANLFHAVVELQRLRASSERKFQRWFFDVRTAEEQLKEKNGILENALEEERRGRADAIREAVEHERTHERANSKAQKQLAEMKRELTISKEEARRAWEELGRREQEERDRTVSLENGLPTIVGGVQVVPMTQGIPTRHGSTRSQAQESSYQRQSPQSQQQQQHQVHAPAAQQDEPGSPSQEAHGGYYHQQAMGSHGRQEGYGQGSETGFSEEDYEESEPKSSQPSKPATSYPPNSSQYYQAGADYSGQGYGTPSWTTVPHHHPTRLSDVIEEDEHSRTSASQVSRG